MSFAFAGTPEFAAWVLRDLEGLGRRPCVVITQPDRPRGRGRKLLAPPAAVEARRAGIECLQTDDINSAAVGTRLREAGAARLVVASFGQILKEPLLSSILCLNIHASLLPAYRGAAPIERALAAGEQVIGVSIMQVTASLDAGPVALQKSVSVGLRDDAGTVARILALLGAVGIDEVLTGLDDDTVSWTEQEGPTSYAQKLFAAGCALDPSLGAKALHDQVRSLSPGVGTRAACGEVRFKVWRTWPYGEPALDPVPGGAETVAGQAGELAAQGGRLFVGCARGVAEILSVQPEGRGTMTAAAFLRGYSGRLAGRLTWAECERDPDAEGP